MNLTFAGKTLNFICKNSDTIALIALIALIYMIVVTILLIYKFVTCCSCEGFSNCSENNKLAQKEIDNYNNRNLSISGTDIYFNGKPECCTNNDQYERMDCDCKSQEPKA